MRLAFWIGVAAIAFAAGEDDASLCGGASSVTLTHDGEGLAQAYESEDGFFYDAATCTQYLRGTDSLQDVGDDVAIFEQRGATSTGMYGAALATYERLTASGRPVRRLVGHSLGGAVALALARTLAARGVAVETRTFAALVADLRPRASYDPAPERYRHPLDLLSSLDRGAAVGPFALWPHSYFGFDADDPHHSWDRVLPWFLRLAGSLRAAFWQRLARLR